MHPLIIVGMCLALSMLLVFLLMVVFFHLLSHLHILSLLQGLSQIPRSMKPSLVFAKVNLNLSISC